MEGHDMPSTGRIERGSRGSFRGKYVAGLVALVLLAGGLVVATVPALHARAAAPPAGGVDRPALTTMSSERGPRVPADTPTATATPNPACQQAWNLVSSPNVGSSSNYLAGVAVVSPDDVWA